MKDRRPLVRSLPRVVARRSAGGVSQGVALHRSQEGSLLGLDYLASQDPAQPQQLNVIQQEEQIDLADFSAHHQPQMPDESLYCCCDARLPFLFVEHLEIL